MVLGALCILLLGYGAYIWFTLPDVSDPRSFLAAQSTVVLDRNGVELYRFFQEEDRTFVDADAIPQFLKDAIVAIEDERFYSRGCLDVRAIARAFFGFGRAGGASTITRQLARNALDLNQENLYNRKVKEIILGCQLESQNSKKELLHLYLNWIPFGRNAYGAQQASMQYFGVPVTDLTLAQSAVLAALPQRPSYLSPYGAHRHTTVSSAVEEQIIAGKITRAHDIPSEDIAIGLLGAYVGTGATVVYVGGRTDQVLQNMQDQEMITESERLAALSDLEHMLFQPAREDIRAPHFVLWIREQVEELFAGSEQDLLQRGGMTITTTLDWDLQEAAESAVALHREDIFNRFGARNLALLALDPKTREVLAYVGNADFHDEEHGGKIDMVHVPRQPGSSFKPIVYAAAFEQGYGPGTVLFDVPTKIGDDEPQNFDGTFWGPLTVRAALGASRNIPAAKAFFLAGGEMKILQLAAALGANTPLTRRAKLSQQRGSFEYGWPLALGAAETPLIEMVNAYASLGDGGVVKPVVSIQSITDKHGNILFQSDAEPVEQSVLDARIAYQITSILRDESARPEEYWRSQLTVPGYETAAKTGTSNKCLEWNQETGACLLRKPDNAWLLGYTPSLVAGVWAGNADSSALYDRGGGLNTASPLWRDFMIRAHKRLSSPVTSFTSPSGLVQVQISTLSGQLPTECTPLSHRRTEIFLSERVPVQQDPACQMLAVDKVTGMLASEVCPAEAQEEGRFFHGQSILPDRWPTWEQGVQAWMDAQMELWNATDTHSGALIPLPKAPTEICDPSLTPGRLIAPEVHLRFPLDGGMAPYPAFVAQIEWDVGSSVREVRYELNGRRVGLESSPPFSAVIRVPRSVPQEGTHVLKVILEDEYFNQAEDEVMFRFGEDRQPPSIQLVSPEKRLFAPGETAVFHALAEDTEGGIKYVQFYLDDLLLTTKPHEPYSVTYTLPKEDGLYRLRAVAEDMAENTGSDMFLIGVGDVTIPDDRRPLPSLPQDPVLNSSDRGVVLDARDPAILTPSDDISMQRKEVREFSFQVPRIGGDIAQLTVWVQHEQTGDISPLLTLTDGEGIYRRDWSTRLVGDHILILATEDSAGTVTEWDRRRISVR